jgi:hypothetical protein
MATRPKRRFWRICGIYFRRFRITVWFVLFVLLSVLVYLNQVGLPDFAKRPLLQKLHDRGLDLQFSRLRLRWYQGIVADNARFGRADEPLGPQLTVGEVQVLLNLRSLRRLKFQVDELVLRRGHLIWPIAETNQPLRQLGVDRIETHLRFLSDDQWALDNFKATFAGANIRLAGIITNASAVRDWKFVPQTQPAPQISALELRERLRRLSDTLERIRFPSPPELVLDVRGDARDLQSFGAVMILAARGADTPWGSVTRGRFNARIFPGATNGMSHAELHLEAAHAQTPWAAVTNFILNLNLVSFPHQTNLVEADLQASARTAVTRWGSSRNSRFGAHWVQAMPQPVPISAHGWLEGEDASAPWASARQFEIYGDLQGAPETDTSVPHDPNWGWWTNLQPYLLNCQCQLKGVTVSNLIVDGASFEANWHSPKLAITNLEVQLYDGSLKAQTDLDVSNRAFNLTIFSNVDPKKLMPIVPAEARQWLDQFSWSKPPRVNGEISLVLPAWTNREPDYRSEVLPGLSLNAEVDLEQGANYQQKLQVSSIRSHVIYSNMSWYLPDLFIRRPEGSLLAEHRSDDRTGDFYWHVSSTVDVGAIRPLLAPDAQKVFELFTLTEPPVLDAELWGGAHDEERVRFKGRAALTNFTFRGKAISGLQTSLQYSNRLLQFFEPRIQCGTNQASADGVAADFNAQLIYLTNGISTLDPMVIGHVIGPEVERAIQPYHFLQPPAGRVQGIIPMHGEDQADLHFDLDGGPFNWWKFRLPHISGHVHWAGESLSLSDVQADFYGGKAAGAAKFDFRPQKGTDFLFALGVTNVQFHALMGDLSQQTNHLEGLVSGALSVTKANTEDWRTVNGYGETQLRDGLLWDIPLFGIFSPVLNGLSPGLGNSRASAAMCSFVITNGVVFSPDLDIRSTGMRLKYHGTVDLENRLNARVEAELLRDMWLVGPFVSTLFWPVTKMFEYRVTGVLEEPKLEPVFIVPKIMLMPFHPFRSSKGSKPEETLPSTNAPPVNAAPAPQ